MAQSELVLGDGQTGQETEAEPAGQKGQSGGGQESTAQSATEDQSQGQGTSEDNSLIPDVPEQLKAKEKELLAAFHKKTQALAQRERQTEMESAAYKKDAEVLYKLTGQSWFKEALERQRTSKTGPAPVNVSEEQFQAVTSDRESFERFMAERDKALYDAIAARLESRVGGAEDASQEIRAELEFKATAARYADFEELHDAGELEEFINAGHSYEDAYGLYKFRQGETPEKVREEAARQIEAKKRASVGKDGLSRPGGGPVVKAKNINEAIDRAFELISKGTKDFKIERT